ncbi:MAG: enoyl-CoA hydratase/isomerase family protein [Nitrococcus mobilis]|nr:enoyl-CoA hydratase/isomerase family protein [Nitrococcus mobilis]
MQTERLITTIEGPVARITLDRPELRNAFDDRLIAELTGTLERFEQDRRLRLVILSAAGTSFSAGADLNWMRRTAAYSWQENFADAQRLGRLMQTLDQLALPTLAQVQGAALGGGVGLVAACDIAVAADTAFFALAEVKLGLIPAVISPYVIRAIGARAARRYFLTGERITAQEALRLGLVHEVVPNQQLDARLAALVRVVLDNGPQAVRAAKRLIRTAGSGAIDAALIEETARRIAEQRASSEAKEGVSAFLEKRKPDWH